MARIPEEMIEEIRTKTDIVDLIGEYIQLTKRGKNWFGLCPFHGENTPSFSVSEDKQLFHCFGCGASGNAITFVMDLESRTFTETISKLAERIGVGIDVIPVGGSGHTNQQEFKQMMDAHALATNFYSHILLNTVEGEKALEYLEKRGFSRASIEKYGIGWALDDFEALSGLLKRKGFNMQEMERSGLCIMKDDGTGYFDRFRGRIMFPLWDDTGNVIAFSGRSLYEDKEVAKYLNSPETPIFEKGKVLYNLHNARLNIRKTGKVILFEGFMDTISADHVDVGNSVAIMGTSLSESHLLKLKRIAKELIICCDGDSAGWEAAKRFATIANANGMNIRIALLPNDMDPDEFIQEYGGEAFREQIIGNPHSYMSFIMAYAKRSKNLSYENDVLQFIHEVLEELALRPSPVERDLYIRQLSEETNVSVEAINQQFIKMAGNRARQAKADSMSPTVESRNMPSVPKTRQKTGTERAERLLLHHLLNDGSLFDRFKEEKREVFFHEDYATIFVRLAGFYEQYKKPDFHRFAESIEDRELRKLVLEAALLESDSDHAEKEIEDCIIHLEKKRIEIAIQEKMHESKEAERVNNHTRALELAREIIQLRNSLAAL
ncbi:DNA primase [Sporosarcina ureilytica]|uniref:DNA primase n=1 Tax=Sporosarcina ureilytica TaxID=298596 RepID=A0A1D8JGQ3_9BACL|nr:DNA primase [Sporosarcina ureilytica]AOV07878.1 DNA primase [Sporosarcina ureilytica]